MSTVPNVPEEIVHRARNGSGGSPSKVHSDSTTPGAIENFRPLRVVVIGAGFSGINCAIRIPERLRNIDLTVYEKNADVGGTWYENTYPGCACDVPAHSYQYSYSPNPSWSSFYAPGPEIRQYLQDTAKKFSATRFIKCNHRVESCEWDSATAKWKLQVRDLRKDQMFLDEANIVVSARGSLNDYKWPAIPGLKDFKGILMHSAAWDPSVNLSRKTVGVIGAGSSAIQIVPELQALPGAQLKCFIRSKTWISPPFGEQTMARLGLKELTFSDEKKRSFIENPGDYHDFRKSVEQDGNSVHFLTQADSEMQKNVREYCEGVMNSRLSSRPDIAKKITPAFAVGCRRLTPGLGFLEALTQSNVEFIPNEIRAVTATGIELQDGAHVDLDALICATGFNAAHAPPFPVTGVNCTSMASQFKPFPKTYLSILMTNFPNFFSVLGPNSLIGTGSLSMMIEAEVDYIVKCIRKIQRENIRSMDAKFQRVEEFSDYIDQYFKKSVYLDGCSSWYLNDGGQGSRVIGIWPGSCLHAMEAFRSPRWEDFNYDYLRDSDGRPVSQMAWLGEGFTHAQAAGDGDLAYYLEPEYLDVPAAPRPEDTRMYRLRPFCY